MSGEHQGMPGECQVKSRLNLKCLNQARLGKGLVRVRGRSGDGQVNIR